MHMMASDMEVIVMDLASNKPTSNQRHSTCTVLGATGAAVDGFTIFCFSSGGWLLYFLL